MPTVEELQQQFGNIGPITKFVPSDEGGGYFRYESDPRFRRTTEFGPGLSNIRATSFSQNTDPLASEYGILPSEQTATPTEYEADLTAPDEEGYYLTARFSPSGEMIGSPERKKYEPDWFRKNPNIGFALPLLFAGGAGLLSGSGAGLGVAATEAALGELGINTALAAGTPGGIAAGTTIAQAAPSLWESAQLGYQSLKDALNIGQMIAPDAPAAVQGGINRFATGLVTSGGNVEKAAQGALLGGLGDIGNVALADVPAAARGPLINVVTQLAQGKDIESALQNAAAGSLSSIAGSELKDLTGSQLVGGLGSDAVRQLVTTGQIDPTKLVASSAPRLLDTVASSISGGLNQVARASQGESREPEETSGRAQTSEQATTSGQTLASDRSVSSDQAEMSDQAETTDQAKTADKAETSKQAETSNRGEASPQAETSSRGNVQSRETRDDRSSGSQRQSFSLMPDLASAGFRAITSQIAPNQRRRSNTQTSRQTTQQASGQTRQTGASQTQGSTRQQVSARPSEQVDVSKLIPIVRSSSQSGPALRVDVSTLTPISQAATLSSIVGNKAG